MLKMKVTLLFALLVGCSAVPDDVSQRNVKNTPSAYNSPAGQPSPAVYTSSDGQFCVTFPLPPEVEVTSGSLAVSVTGYKGGQMTLFRDPNPQKSEILPDRVGALTEPLLERDWRITSTRKQNCQGHPSVSCVAEKPGARLEATEIVTPQFIYRLIVSGTSESFALPEFRQFTDSFQFLPAKNDKTSSATGDSGERDGPSASEKVAFERVAKSLNIKDTSTAFRECLALAESGNPLAECSIGIFFEEGVGCDRDASRAETWYRKAAAKGMAPAQYRLGAMYFKGSGVARDYTQAFHYLKEAGDQEYTAAQANLGILYSEGLGVTQDYEKAAKYYLAAANKGVALSQSNLAELCFYGCGVPQDYSVAYQWYWIAESSGDWKAKSRLEELRRILPASKLSQAETRARNIRKKILARKQEAD